MSSPTLCYAVVHVDRDGRIAVANETARRWLQNLVEPGQALGEVLPAVATELHSGHSCISEPIRVGHQQFAACSMALPSGGHLIILSQTRSSATRATLRAQGCLYESVAHMAHGFAVFALDLDGNVAYWGPDAEHLFGFRPDNIIGRPAAVLFTAEDILHDAPSSEMLKAASAGLAEDVRWHRCQDGSSVWLEGVMVALKSADAIYGFAKVVQDQTARRQAELALAAESERLNTTLQALHEGLIGIDAQGRVTAINAAARDILRVDDAFIGRPLSELLPFLGQGTLLPALMEGRHRRETVSPIIIKSRERSLSWSGAPIPRGGGAVVLLRDVTDELRAQARLERRHKLESVALFGAHVMQELNDAFSAMHSNLSILRFQTQSNTAAQRALDDIDAAIGRAHGLRRRLVQFAAMEPLARTHTSLAELVPIWATKHVSARDVTLKMSVAPDVWPVEIDDSLLERAVCQVLNNATEAMPLGGTLEIDLHNEPANADGVARVCLQIRDTGVGIPREWLPRIFEPFFTTKQAGSGGGLPMVHNVVQRHGGTIDIESEHGKGTTVIIHLPAASIATPKEKGA